MEDDHKILRYARLTAWFSAALLGVVTVVSLLLVPKALRMMDHAEQTLAGIDTLAQTADAALTTANEAAESANRLVADNADSVAEAMEKFNSVDFATLNRAIDDLADVVEPLAKVANFFK